MGSSQEEARIGRTLHDLAAHLADGKYGEVEVVVVAASRPDGTSDRTVEITQAARPLFDDLRLVLPGRRAGKGRDTQAGMLSARGRLRVFMDADLATPLHHLDQALTLIASGCDVVIGVRDLTSSHTGWCKRLSTVGNRLVQAVLLPGVTDTQCGFKMFTSSAAQEAFGRQTVLGWGFDMEVLAIARLLRARIGTLAVPDWQEVAGGTFSGGVLRAAARTLLDLVRVNWHVVTGTYRRSSCLPLAEAETYPDSTPDRGRTLRRAS